MEGLAHVVLLDLSSLLRWLSVYVIEVRDIL